MIELSAENEAVRTKNHAEPGASGNGASPLKFVGSQSGAIGGGHIMFEGQPGDVFASFEGELQREREEVLLAKVGDLVSEEPGVLSERCLNGDSQAICVQESNVRLGKKLCQCI